MFRTVERLVPVVDTHTHMHCWREFSFFFFFYRTCSELRAIECLGEREWLSLLGRMDSSRGTSTNYDQGIPGSSFRAEFFFSPMVFIESETVRHFLKLRALGAIFYSFFLRSIRLSLFVKVSVRNNYCLQSIRLFQF